MEHLLIFYSEFLRLCNISTKMGCVSGLSELIQAQFPTRYYPVYYNQRCSYLADQSVRKYTRIMMEMSDDCVFVTGIYLKFFLTFALVDTNRLEFQSPMQIKQTHSILILKLLRR